MRFSGTVPHRGGNAGGCVYQWGARQRMVSTLSIRVSAKFSQWMARTVKSVAALKGIVSSLSGDWLKRMEKSGINASVKFFEMTTISGAGRLKKASRNCGLIPLVNLIRMDPVKRKGGIKARRLIAATSVDYMSSLLGLRESSCDCPVSALNSFPLGIKVLILSRSSISTIHLFISLMKP